MSFFTRDSYGLLSLGNGIVMVLLLCSYCNKYLIRTCNCDGVPFLLLVTVALLLFLVICS